MALEEVRRFERCPACNGTGEQTAVPIAHEVEAEVIRLRVGTLTIDTPHEPGQPARAFGSKIQFDGKEPDIGITRLDLVCDLEDGVWRVKLHGFPRGRGK
jgi:hypothetical protein